MRTTLDIDDDVLVAAKERARRERRTTGQVLSELARTGLLGRRQALPLDDDGFYGFAPLPHRGDAVSNALIDQLRDDEHA